MSERVVIGSFLIDARDDTFKELMLRFSDAKKRHKSRTYAAEEEQANRLRIQRGEKPARCARRQSQS
jgi:hypothetical protein